MKKRKRVVRFHIENHQQKVKIDCTKIMTVLEKGITFFNPPPLYINISLVSNKKIKELNRKFLQKSTPTDILSFKISRYEGEVIISAEMAAENCKKYGMTVEDELLYLIIHGYLHLKNYTDYTEKEIKRMFRKQDRIFKIIKEFETQ
ncbi:MAG: rRNA maturation RNase YbeY [Candidatus Omnitrophica bacterium]|nr:rRNA maturation RNase YbeY [Candidatus Omnitrophota bacterium]